MSSETFFVLEVTSDFVRYSHQGAYLDRESAEKDAETRLKQISVPAGSGWTLKVFSASEINAKFNGGMAVRPN